MLHDTVVIYGTIEVEDGVDVGAFTVLVGPLKLGSGVFIGSHCVVGNKQGLTVGQDSYIDHHSVIRCSRIGKNVQIGCYTNIYFDTWVEDYVTLSPGTGIGEKCLIQRYSETHPDAKIRNNLIVGAGCKVKGNTNDNINPSENFDCDKISLEEAQNLYDIARKSWNRKLHLV